MIKIWIFKKIVFSSFLLLVALIWFPNSSRAAASDYYRNLLARRFGVYLSAPPQDVVKLKLPSEPLSPLAFNLSEPVDFLVVNLQIGQEYLPGRVVLEKFNGQDFQAVWVSQVLVPELLVKNDFGLGDFRISVFREGGSLAEPIAINVQAFRYKRLLTDYLDSDWYLFTSSEISNLDLPLQGILGQKRVLFLCDELSPVVVLGRSCQFDSVVSLPGDLVDYKDRLGKNLILVPFSNRNLVLLSPKIFGDDDALKALKTFLDESKKSYPVPLKITLASLGRVVLDYYRAVFNSDWLRGSVLAVLILAFLLAAGQRRKLFSASFLRDLLVKIKLHFFLTLSRIRGFALFFLFLFLAELLVAFSSNRIVESLRLYRPVYLGYLYFKENIGQTFSFADLRHILEAIFLTGALVALVVSFLDKIILLSLRLLRQALKLPGPKPHDLKKLTLVSLAFIVFFRIFNFPSLILYPTAALLYGLLLIAEVRSLTTEKIPSQNQTLTRGWLFTYLALGGLAISVLLAQKIHSHPGQPVFTLDEARAVTVGSKRKLVALPQWSHPLARGQKYLDLTALPNQPLWAGDFLIFYPGVDHINYLGKEPSAGLIKVDQPTVIYFRPEKFETRVTLEKLVSLAPFLNREKFRSQKELKSQTSFSQSHLFPDQHYFFYTYLSAGENGLRINYLDLNSTARSINSTLKVYGTQGDLVAKVTEKNQEYFKVGLPQVKSVAHHFNIPEDDVYILELSFEDEPSGLAGTNKAFLQSLEFPSNAVYYVRPEILNGPATPTQSSEATSSAKIVNPFSFSLVDFGVPSDQVLVFGFEKERLLEAGPGPINLGEILNLLNDDRPQPQKFLINYGPRAEFLPVSEEE